MINTSKTQHNPIDRLMPCLTDSAHKQIIIQHLYDITIPCWNPNYNPLLLYFMVSHSQTIEWGPIEWLAE